MNIIINKNNEWLHHFNGCESTNHYAEEPTLSSFEKLLTRARERHYFRDASVLYFIELNDGLSAEDLQAKGYK